jgi:CheY-like chemotaxis protein
MSLTNVEAVDVYRCHSCDAMNFAGDAEWCLCTGPEQTLVCGSCGSCFCSAELSWKRQFWAAASPELQTRRREHRKHLSPLGTAGENPDRPVILLIDDDRTVHAIVSRVLEGRAGTLLHAYDGETGLQIAREVQPELVITDALLPKVDGRELTRTLKSDPATANGKVIIITALYKGTRYRTEAMINYLADEFMEKPVSAEKLRTTIDQMIGGGVVQA